ncbi:hypothetical protein ACFOKJ_01680, partial [Vogesella amnigena]
DFVSCRRQQRRRTIPIAPNRVNSELHEKTNEFDKCLICKAAKKQKSLAAARLAIKSPAGAGLSIAYIFG